MSTGAECPCCLGMNCGVGEQLRHLTERLAKSEIGLELARTAMATEATRHLSALARCAELTERLAAAEKTNELRRTCWQEATEKQVAAEARCAELEAINRGLGMEAVEARARCAELEAQKTDLIHQLSKQRVELAQLRERVVKAMLILEGGGNDMAPFDAMAVLSGK